MNIYLKKNCFLVLFCAITMMEDNHLFKFNVEISEMCKVMVRDFLEDYMSIYCYFVTFQLIHLLPQVPTVVTKLEEIDVDTDENQKFTAELRTNCSDRVP